MKENEKALLFNDKGQKMELANDGTQDTLFRKIAGFYAKLPYGLYHLKAGDELCDIEKTLEGPVIRNNFLKLERSRHERAWLVRVDAQTNSYDFVKILPYNMGSAGTVKLLISSGRYGAGKRDLGAESFEKEDKDACLYHLLIADLLCKGYVLSNELFVEEDKQPARKLVYKEGAALKLYRKLEKVSRTYVSKVLDVSFMKSDAPYSKAQVKKAWKLWGQLREAKTVSSFNKKMTELMVVTPRRIDAYHGMTVESFLASTASTAEEQAAEFARIIDREETLINAMEAAAGLLDKKKDDETRSPFGNIDIEYAKGEEKEKVMAMIPPAKRTLVADVYKVVHHDQKKKFDEYVEREGIKETRLLWHGSKAVNWFSIIVKSLLLNPIAAITGKMWGNGIYFAPDFNKSWGYTDVGKWVGGSAEEVYMALFRTAFGTPWYPTCHVHGTRDMVRKHGGNCLYAKKGVAGLYADEVIFFDEDAICIEYLVSFKP